LPIIAPASRLPSRELRPANKLLASLPDDDFARLQPQLQTIPVKLKYVFHASGAPLREVFFPNGGVASITTVMHDGRVVETATVGKEGMVGMEAFWGAERTTGQTMMQVSDTSAERLSVSAFKAELDRRGALYNAVQRYSQALMVLMMHSTACMALHQIQERCCRWLLMTHDRVSADQFQLSHEFLAMMLGATRPTVTVVVGTLQKAGLITSRHGRFTVLDRPGLEDASCECYAAVQHHFDRLGL
jgi:CRP-like cAMP-binding protein